MTEEWLDGSQNVIRTISSIYDLAGRLISISDADSSFVYSYDDLNRVTSIDNDGTPDVPRVVLHMAYDSNGNRSTLSSSLDAAADLTNAYLYDAINRLTRITQSGTGVAAKRVDFAYDENSRYQSIVRYADLTGTSESASTGYTFDDAGRLTNLNHSHDSNTISNYTWTYNAKGQLTSFTGPDGETDYAYDATGQLTGADSDYRMDETYSYDESGNRTMSGYVTDANNRLTSDGTYSYQYDNEGNRTRKTTIATGDYVEYTWDHRNRLTAVTFKDDLGATTKTVGYIYDVFNRRIEKSINSATTERYVYDGENILFVFDGSGTLKARYLQGPGLDNTLAQEDGNGNTSWLLPDHQGTIRDVVENDGDVLNHITYDSFGNILTQTGSTNEPRYTYTGREWDNDAGIFYYRARWYDAGVGRFISEDPIGFAGGDSNLQRYVGNDPGNRVDPAGLQAYDNKDGLLLPVDDLQRMLMRIPPMPELAKSVGGPIGIKMLEQYLADLEERKDYDWNANGGKEGPNGAWLWKEVNKIKKQLLQMPTIFAYVERPIREDDCKDAMANAIGNHVFVTTVAPPWHMGQVIGYGITDSKAKQGQKPTKEVYQPGERYSIYLTYRTNDVGHYATDREVAVSIANYPMGRDYFAGIYDCRDWAKAALSNAGLSMRYNMLQVAEVSYIVGGMPSPSTTVVRASPISEAEWAATVK